MKPSVQDFDGDRLVPLLGAPYNDERLAAILTELGRSSPVEPKTIVLPFKKLGIGLTFANEPRTLLQVQFELRRKGFGYKPYRGRLPYGISPDLAEHEAATALADRAELRQAGDDCFVFGFPAHDVNLVFGERLLAAVFVGLR
jgi:hypothetical protein